MVEAKPSITLLEIRAKNKITQKQFAKSIGVSTQTVSSWESDILSISIPNLIKVCKTYNVSSVDLLGY